MRISDWSSDVCSSDLTIAPRAWWAEPCAVDGRHPALVRRASFDENPVPFAPPCRPAHSSAIAGSDYARSDQLARSEEHTSELQSLMRISYAVFCLKKKKNIQCDTSKKKEQDNNTI